MSALYKSAHDGYKRANKLEARTTWLVRVPFRRYCQPDASLSDSSSFSITSLVMHNSVVSKAVSIKHVDLSS